MSRSNEFDTVEGWYLGLKIFQYVGSSNQQAKPSHRMYGEIRCGGQPGSNVVQEVIVNSSMKPTFQWSYMFKFSRLDPSFIGKVPSFYGFIWEVLITYVSSLMFGVTGS